MKNPRFSNGEFYHIYNRGTDKRTIFSDKYDLQRFLQSMDEFNTIQPAGSIYEISFLNPIVKAKRKQKRIVRFVAYCINPNHYHFVLQQAADGGISEFMKRLSGGYTWYFNNKHGRSGSLFQGTFKAKHIDSNEYLLHLSAYVNLNYRVHRLGGVSAKSSWGEYVGTVSKGFCETKVILKQFRKPHEYKNFAESSLIDILERKQRDAEFKSLLLE